MKKYEISKNVAKNIVEVSVTGLMDEENANNFLKDYSEITKSISASSYDILIDCTSMSVAKADLLHLLEECFKLYIQTGFKKVIFKISNNPVLKMQLTRIAKKTNLQNYEILEV